LSLELVQLIFTEIEKLSTLAADQFSDFIKDNYLPPLLSQTVNLKKDFNINEFSFELGYILGLISIQNEYEPTRF